MDRMEKKKNGRNFRKSIAFTLVMAMLVSTISFGAGLLGDGGEGKAYAEIVDPISEAVSSTLTSYYGAHENYVLDNWEEMAAVKASGGNLEDYKLPNTDTGTASSTVIGALIKGDITKAAIEANKIVSRGALVSVGDAYKYALNMIAIEAYNRSVSGENKIVYSTIGAINTLLGYRTDGVFLDPYNQKLGGDMVGMSLVALSAFSGDRGVVDEAIIVAKEQIKKMQKSSGAFEGAWGNGSTDANTTAIIVMGLMAVDSSNLSSYTTGGALKTPIDGLLSYYVAGGGYWYSDSAVVDAYATKQSALAIADIKNNNSFYANLSASAINYVGAKAQVITANGAYTEKNLTMGGNKSIAKAMQRALATNDEINPTDYNIYINGDLEVAPEDITVKEGDTILAIANVFTKVAYFKAADLDTLGVNDSTVTFGGSKELTLVEMNLQNGVESVLSGKPISFGTAIASNNGTTDADGKIMITPVEANLKYEISAKRKTTNYLGTITTTHIEQDTAILPVEITMSSGTQQTATVGVRIEGPSSNVLNNTAFTVARTDGSRLTVYDAVTQALSQAGIPYVQNSKYISSIDGFAAGSFGIKQYDGWMYNIIKPEYLNGTSSLYGMGTQFISEGEEIVVYYGNDDMSTVYPFVTSKLNTDGSVIIEIKNYETNWETTETNLVSTSGVMVDWGYTSDAALTYSVVTDTNGKATIPATYALTGQHSLQISKGSPNLPDVIRLAPNYSVGISSSGTSEGSGGSSIADVSYVTVKGPNGNLKARTAYAWYNGMSVLNILQSSGLRIETDNSGNYVQSVEGVGEFDLGKNSGWLYSVNVATPTNKASNSYILSPNDNVLWYYTMDFTKDTSSSSWVNDNAGVGGTANTVSVNTDVTAKLDSKGNAAVVVSAAELSASIKKAVDGLAGDNTGKQTEIKINVDMDDKALSLDTTIPKASFGNLITNKIGMLTIASALGEISLDLNTLKTIFSEATGDISISITKAEKTDGRPSVDLSVMSNDKKITEFGGIVTVSIPYILASGEKASGIKVYYVTEEGKLVDVKSSSYEESNKMATFQTDHFSKFLIAYNQITFNDIQGHWAQAYIELLANRNIINGMTETTFVPDGNITRAQFAKLLAGLEGVDLSKYTTSKFGDVSQNAWYSGAVAWASDNNITLGYANADGTKNFNPNQNITRQDMAVMMKRYLDNVAKKTLSAVDAKIAFVDDKIIADYSKEAVLQLQQAGIINGKITQTGGTEFDPTGKLTRAEAAKIVASQL